MLDGEQDVSVTVVGFIEQALEGSSSFISTRGRKGVYCSFTRWLLMGMNFLHVYIFTIVPNLVLASN